MSQESKELKQQRCDYSFIAALYDNQSGLYKEVYFPIIKYSIRAVFNADLKKEFFETEEIYNYIQANFGLTIPQIVLQRVIYSLAEKYPKEIMVFEKDTTTFQVKKPWDIAENKAVVEKTKRFNEQLAILEKKYKEYIIAEELNTDTTFVDFISDNTEDVLGYFDSKIEEVHIDENYYFLANFLQKIEQKEKDIYETANKLFWGSIIAGFLRRENPTFSSSDIEKEEEYFLDTPIVLSLLDLSTEKHHQYALDTINLLKKSGRYLHIHPITLKEVRSVLQKVEANGGPYPNSDIANAYDRRRLKPSIIAGIRVRTERDLNSLGVSLFPNYSEQVVQNIIREKKGDPLVEMLRTLRYEGRYSLGTESWYSDFREIHDIFMFEYVKERGEKTGKIVRFVTLNEQLVEFVKGQSNNYCGEFINPNRITLNLWMHNSISITAANNLTEVLTRCQIQGESDLRRKLGIVSKYYNEESPNFDLATYKSIILSIFRRDRDVIGYIEELEENDKHHHADKNQSIVAKVSEASLRSTNVYQTKNKDLLEQNEELRRSIKGLTDKLDKSSSDNESFSFTNNVLSNEIAKAHERNETLRISLKRRDEEIEKNKVELSMQKKKSELQEELIRLKDDFNHAQKELDDLILERDKSVSYGKAVPLFLIYVLIAGMMGLCVMMMCNSVPVCFSNWQKWTGIIALFLTVLGASFYAKYLFAPKSLLNEIRREHRQQWEDLHPKFGETSARVIRTKESLEMVEQELENLKAGSLPFKESNTYQYR